MFEQQKILSKQNFQETNASLFKLYKESLRMKEAQYIQGKEDAYAEIIKLLQGFKSARDLKHVPITQFMMALNQKLKELREPKLSFRSTELDSIPPPPQQLQSPSVNMDYKKIAINALANQAERESLV